MLVLIAARRRVRRDEHARIRPQARWWRMLELTNIDVEGSAAQMFAGERVRERLFVDDLATRDVDQHAPGLHGSEASGIEQAVRLRGPLASDHHELAFREIGVEISG